MRIGGKLLGGLFGFFFGGPLGALFGLWLGHRFDKALGRVGFMPGGGFAGVQAQQQFLHTSFAVMGHVAKSTGVVTQHEIQVASLLMQQLGLHGEARQRAQQAFREGKASDFPLEATLQEFMQNIAQRRDLLQMFMEIQLQAAFADGVVEEAEQRVLERIALALGFSKQDLQVMLSRWEAEVNFHRQRQGGQGQTRPNSQAQLAEAYKILGIEQDVSDQDVKRAHRKLMSQHHPDKLVAKGLPEEMMELAKQRTQDIQQAYELVKQQRGMR